MHLGSLLTKRLKAGFIRAGVDEKFAEPKVKLATQPEFDYQADGAIHAAKSSGLKPAELAKHVTDVVDLSDIVASIDVSSQGFINLIVANDALAAALEEFRIEPVGSGRRIVVDYSRTNLSEKMQLHHLRSTIVGDAIARILEALGYNVIRQNHIGDWNPKPGMMSDCQDIHDTLGVSLKPEHIRGESTYKTDLDNVVNDLRKKGLLENSQGALCVFLPEFKSRDGNIVLAIIKKSNGDYLYFSRDLAALRHRYQADKLRADRVLYIVGADQSTHFSKLFALAKLAGYGDSTSFEHHPIGPIRLRNGENSPELLDLLHQTVKKARTLVEKRSGLSPAEINAVARAVGIGAFKYADLSRNRANEYVFDLDAILPTTTPNTPATGGPQVIYLQYAYARIQGLLSGRVDLSSVTGKPVINTLKEHELALQLVHFQETLEKVAATIMPHHLCDYLYNLAQAFMRFYETHPGAQYRNHQLLLCRLTAETLAKGLELLGIEVVDWM